MSKGTAASRSPLFLRIFVRMLACVAVVQLLNFGLLFAVQTPNPKLHTVGQIVQAMRNPAAAPDGFEVVRAPAVERQPWNPRVERTEVALATALGVPHDQVILRFPVGFLQRPQVYNRAGLPPAPAPASAAAAQDVVVTGGFQASMKLPDGSWRTVSPGEGLEPWRLFVIVWLVLSALAAAVFAWAMAQRFARPIGAFARAAERLGRDPRAPPIELDGPAEIAEAARAFNDMQARLNRYVDDRATMIAAVAHDLRTPLMRLGLRVEDADPGIRAACEGDIREMQAMISAVMAYVRDSSRIGVRRPLDLRSLAETVVDDAADRGADVSLELGDPVVIEADPVALKAMLANLVGNAVKYAGGAELLLSARDHEAVITVRDRGPGIPDEDMERVFDPFFRGERSRNRDTGGMGLGLASARATARAHGGDITLHRRSGGGLCATVTLPL
ncbi:Signal transduction histidine kinase [Sphingomonas sp. NFR04]|uniref:ATP-binding protein n=1 Tax=Sphingomonas sp. NFR04 TaxID=1566283 RepID=UPI0008E4EC78|nr:HAMP domain-containing sensor histidine kinase [Sphingomonas sp. NFR04]SFK26285.1 Signal transduction histidine kinase [Sphingomonas sp. NFR04]